MQGEHGVCSGSTAAASSDDLRLDFGYCTCPCDSATPWEITKWLPRCECRSCGEKAENGLRQCRVNEWVRHFALSAGAHGVPGLLSPNKCRTPGDLATSGQSLLSPRKCQGKKHDMFTIALWEFYVRFEAGLLWAGWAGWAGATPTSFSEGWRGRWVVLGAEIPPGSFASRGSTKTGQDVGLAGLLRNTC